jgi:hypothetical protein
MKDRKSYFSIMFNSRSVTLIIVALVFLIISETIKNPFIICAKNGCELNLDFVAHITLEISFALIIAFFVSVGIEYQAKLEDIEAKDEMRKQVAEDVFYGVFSKFLPKKYIDAVMDKIVNVEIMRTSMKIIDIFSNHGGTLELERRTVYGIRNISRNTIKHTVHLFFSHSSKASTESMGLQAIIIGGRKIPHKEILNSKVVDLTALRSSFDFDVEIPPNEEIKVEYTSKMPKGKRDQEIFSMNHPCLEFSYSIRFSPKLSRFGISERAISKLKTIVWDQEAGIGDWEMDGPMIRDNSITVWWECD